jgi:hypothetical protein
MQILHTEYWLSYDFPPGEDVPPRKEGHPKSERSEPVTASRAKRENGGLGEDPPGSDDDSLTGPSDLLANQGSYGAVPVTVRRAKRENGGLGEDPPGSDDDSLTGPSDLEVNQGSYGAVPVTARGLGEDLPRSTMTLLRTYIPRPGGSQPAKRVCFKLKQNAN